VPEGSGQQRIALTPLSKQQDSDAEDAGYEGCGASSGAHDVKHLHPRRVPKVDGFAQGTGNVPPQPQQNDDSEHPPLHLMERSTEKIPSQASLGKMSLGKNQGEH